METRLERNNLIVEMKNKGNTINEIAEILDMSFYACRSVLRWRRGVLDGRDYKRELIRKYFDHTCQKCKRIWKEGERRFDVHHLGEGSNKSKIYDDFKDIDTLTLLCHKCHLNLPEHRETMSLNHQGSAG